MEKSIKHEAPMGLLQGITDHSIANIISAAEDEYTNKSQTAHDFAKRSGQDQTTKRRQFKEYINQRRRLRDDMKDACMSEVEFESLTIHSIVDGTAENGAWNTFRKSLSMCPVVLYPTTIKTLQEMMLGYSATLPVNNWDKPGWRFTSRNNSGNWNELHNALNRGNSPNRGTENRWKKPREGTAHRGGTSASRRRGNNETDKWHQNSDNRRNGTEGKPTTIALEQKLLGSIRDLMANWTDAEIRGSKKGTNGGKFILDCAAYPYESFTNTRGEMDRPLTKRKTRKLCKRTVPAVATNDDPRGDWGQRGRSPSVMT